MKTTEIPDELFRRTGDEAALLDRLANQTALRGWLSVFGQARREEVEPIDDVIAAELETVDPDEWR